MILVIYGPKYENKLTSFLSSTFPKIINFSRDNNFIDFALKSEDKIIVLCYEEKDIINLNYYLEQAKPKKINNLIIINSNIYNILLLKNKYFFNDYIHQNKLEIFYPKTYNRINFNDLFFEINDNKYIIKSPDKTLNDNYNEHSYKILNIDFILNTLPSVNNDFYISTATSSAKLSTSDKEENILPPEYDLSSFVEHKINYLNDMYIIQEYIESINEYTTHIFSIDGKIKKSVTYEYTFKENFYVKNNDFLEMKKIELIPEQIEVLELFLLPLKFTGICNINYKLKNFFSDSNLKNKNLVVESTNNSIDDLFVDPPNNLSIDPSNDLCPDMFDNSSHTLCVDPSNNSPETLSVHSSNNLYPNLFVNSSDSPYLDSSDKSFQRKGVPIIFDINTNIGNCLLIDVNSDDLISLITEALNYYSPGYI